MFNKNFSDELNGLIQAGEIFSAAFCNMDCKYCYIPKTDELKDMHKTIIEALKSDNYIEILKKVYCDGESLTSLSFWGTEPTLTLEHIVSKVDKLYAEFKNLNAFDFSTNLLSHYKEIIKFTNAIEKQNRKTNFSMQVSLDGPPEITDYNRKKGSTNAIINNLLDLVKTFCVKKYKNVNIKINFKSTLSMENIIMMVENPNKIEEYFDFFENLFERIDTILNNDKSDNIDIVLSISPTHVVPGSYTSLDGKHLAIFYRLIDTIGKSKKYKYTNTWGQFKIIFHNLLDTNYLAETIPSRITCSGGDCNLGYDINENAHICHRMFFLNNDEYIKGLIENSNDKNWDLKLTEKKSSIDFIKKFYTPNINNSYDMIRFLYLNRGFHDFIKTRQEFVYCALKELAFAGQASPIYLHDDNMALLFSYVVSLAFTCSAESLVVNGQLNSISLSLIRALANGVFEYIIEDYAKTREDKKNLYLRKEMYNEC